MSFPTIKDIFKDIINNVRAIWGFISHSGALVRARIFLITSSAFFTLAAAGECGAKNGNVVLAAIYTALGVLAFIFDTALMYLAESRESTRMN